MGESVFLLHLPSAACYQASGSAHINEGEMMNHTQGNG